MNHADHVNLLRPANPPAGGRWADLGAGTGAFTLALRELVGPEAEIFAVDRDAGSLRELERAFARRFGSNHLLRTIQQDLLAPDGLPTQLDGIVMANSLHYFKDKLPVLRQVHSFISPGGVLLLVEYNVDRGNMWVPYPLSYSRFESLAPQVGLQQPRLLAAHPSSFLREIYSAEARA